MKNQENETGMTLRDLFRVFFRRIMIILSCLILIPLTVFLGLQFKTPLYKATAKMLVTGEQQAGAIYYRDIGPQRNTDLNLTRAETVKSVPVLTMVVDALHLNDRPLDYENQFASPIKQFFVDRSVAKFRKNLDTMSDEAREAFLYNRAIEQLRKKISVETIRNTNLFSISVEDFSPEMSARLANAITLSYMIVDLREQLSELYLKYGNKHPTIQQLNDNIMQIRELMDSNDLTPKISFRPASVKPVEEAIVPSQPIGPNNKLLMLVSIVLGSLLGVSLAIAADSIDHTIKGPRELKSALNLPILGCIPRKKFWQKLIVKNPAWHTMNNDYKDSYRLMADKLRFIVNHQKKKNIVFTSSEEEEGTSTIIANLAYFLSEQHNMKVLVVDANMRTPEIHSLFKLEQSPGLSDVLSADMPLNQAVNRINQKLSIITSGLQNANPSVLLISSAMKALMEKAKDKFDVILIDSPQLKKYQDAIDTSMYADGTILLVSESKTRKHILNAVINPLIEEKIRIIGAILNMRTYVIPDFIYRRL